MRLLELCTGGQRKQQRDGRAHALLVSFQDMAATGTTVVGHGDGAGVLWR